MTEYEYDSAGRPISTLDATGGKTTMTYDAQGRVATQTDPGGGVSSFSYDTSGRVTEMVDPDGVVEQYEYDGRGNVVTQTGTAGRTPSWFSGTGQLLWRGDGDGVFTSYVYDAADQLVAVETQSASYDRASERQTMTYDLDGRRISVVDPRGNIDGADPGDFTTTFAYNADGQLTTTTDALGNISSTAYDALGRPTTVTDPAGGTVTKVYDPAGNVVTAIDQMNAETHFTYDLASNLTAVTNALGNTTQYTYDLSGNLLTQTDPLARTTAAAYDSAGRLVSSTAPSGVTTSFGYDTAGRKSSITYSDTSPAVAYTYSPAGRLLTATRADDGIAATSTTYGYDGLGRTVTVDSQATTPMSTTYTYTGGGRLESAAQSTGSSAFYYYNPAGRVSKATAEGTGPDSDVSFEYDASGRPTAVSRNSLVPATTTYAYDRAGRLTAQSDSVGSTVLTSYQVDRDGRGFPVSVTDDRNGLDPLAPTATTYTYDLAGRVTNECDTDSGPCDGTSHQNTYAYDALGNRSSRTIVTDSGAQPSLDAYAYDAANQLLTVTTDDVPSLSNTWSIDGSLETSATPDGARSYSFSPDGRLAQVELEDDRELQYGYDPNGNRTARTIDGVLDTSWTWATTGEVPVRNGEYDANGNLTTAWLSDPTSATGGLLASADSNGLTSWLLADPFGNVVAEAKADGTTLLEAWDPDLFGRVLDPMTSSPTIAFDGQYQDGLTGLYDMRARDYDPRTGQFLSADPMRAANGDPADNGHAYSFNNPLVFTDVTGQWGWPDLPSWDEYKTLWVDSTKGICQGIADTATGAWQTVRHPRQTVQGIKDQWNADMAEGGLYQAGMFYNPMYHVLMDGAAASDAANAGCFTEAGRSATHATLGLAGAASLGTGTARAGTTLAKIPKTGNKVPAPAPAPAGGSRPIAGPPTVHWGQQEKHIPGHRSYMPGRSTLTANPELLLQRAGTGTPVGNVPRGYAGFRERIDFGYDIGTYAPEVGASSPTTVGILHYRANGSIHIVPGRSQ